MAREVSSWKRKSRYRILAPENFNFRELGVTLSTDPKKTIGRRIVVSLKDLTDDKTKKHINVTFEINKVEGDKALTQFKAFKANPGYIHSKVRKGMSKVDYVGNLKLSDSMIRVKVLAITNNNVQTSQKKEIMKRIIKSLDAYKDSKLNDFIQASIFGKLGTETYHNSRDICPIRRVEIEEVKVV